MEHQLNCRDMDPRIDWIDNRSTNTMPILGLCFLDSKEDKTSRGHFVNDKNRVQKIW